MNQWEGVMQKHAKSFYLASLFFPKKLFPKVKALYALCRWLDDAVDEAPNKQQALTALDSIHEDLMAPQPQLPVIQLYKSNQLDVAYMEDLIEGAKDDLGVVRINDEKELIRYCYKVAGSVGLAMFDLMDVQPRSARAQAVDLGIAMQITNICRDVKEDLQRGRVYLPLQWLENYQIREEDFLRGLINQDQLALVVRKMLSLADQYYLSAQSAYLDIPWRTRGAIIIASDLYRGIGLKLRRQGCYPLRGRTYLSVWEKGLVVSTSLVKWALSSILYRKAPHHQELHQDLGPWKELRNFN